MSGSRAGELNKGGTFDLRLRTKRMGNVRPMKKSYCLKDTDHETKILIFIILFVVLVHAQNKNFILSKQFLNGKISFNEYISKFNTSKKAIYNFIIQSEKFNTNFKTKISKGPVEFNSIVDTLLDNFGKTNNPKYLEILDKINKTVDGYIAEDFSAKVASYVEKYPDTYKNVIIKQGKDSWILSNFLFDKGLYFKQSYIFINKTKIDSIIFNWAEYQTKKYFK